MFPEYRKTPAKDAVRYTPEQSRRQNPGVRMKLFRLLLPAIAAIGISNSWAQETPPPAAATAGTPDPAATLAYIHDAWSTLTRSMTDCHSLVDIKVTAHPILYMPADVAAPPDVAALKEKC